MSLNRIKGLVGDAQRLFVEAGLETEPALARIQNVRADAKKRFRLADDTAAVAGFKTKCWPTGER